MSYDKLLETPIRKLLMGACIYICFMRDMVLGKMYDILWSAGTAPQISLRSRIVPLEFI